MNEPTEENIPFTFPCRSCGKPIHSNVSSEAMADRIIKRTIETMARNTVCEQCAEVAASGHEWHKKQARMRKWEALCPVDFRGTIISKLPRPEKYDEVMRWTFNSLGLMLHGPTRRGKSRCAWKLLERECLYGRRVAVMDYTFGQEYSKRMSTSTAGCAIWLEDFRSADVLLMDDVFKIRMSDGAEMAIFATISERTENWRPIILTTNDTKESIHNRMSPDRGPAICARIREYCTPICFD